MYCGGLAILVCFQAEDLFRFRSDNFFPNIPILTVLPAVKMDFLKITSTICTFVRISSTNCAYRSLSTGLSTAFVTATPVYSSLLTLRTSPICLSIASPMTDVRRRQIKPTNPPAYKPPSNFPIRTKRPIKVLSQATIDESQKKNSSIFSGWRGALFGIVTHLLIGSVFLTIAEGWALIDALYFSIVVATTVGYGDITPKKSISKLFVGFYAIVSVAIIANMLQSLVARLTDAQKELASSARTAVLRSSRASSTDISHTPETDLIVTTRLAAVRTRLRLFTTISMLVGACLAGVVLYRHLLNVPIIDAVYFIFISMTTVGLGDIHPLTPIGKLFSVIWLVIISLSFANILSQYADLRMKEREYDTACSILSSKMGDKMFNEIDDNNDGTLSEAEYLGYILCKLKKASPDDVSLVC